MTPIRLERVEITNFRSIRGHISASLHANTVLIHGENGAGKTSLLSAIEMALLGRVEFLERADRRYEDQLLHRGMQQGRVAVKTAGLAGTNHFEVLLTPSGVSSVSRLSDPLAAFFSERCYLPQSLLGQLLKIYEDSNSAPDSPLARFVSDLLALSRLDAIETGLLPVADLRNFRKLTPSYNQFEFERDRLNRRIAEFQAKRELAQKEISAAMDELLALGFEPIDEGMLSSEDLSNDADEASLHELEDMRRKVQAGAKDWLSDDTEAEGEAQKGHARSLELLKEWEAKFGQMASSLRSRIEELLPSTTLSSDLDEFAAGARSELQTLRMHADDRIRIAKSEISRLAELDEQLNADRTHLSTLEGEIAKIAESSGSLSSALAEIASFIEDNKCPVCERDYTETRNGQLSLHVGNRIRLLSTSAQRLLDLGRARADLSVRIERSERERAEIESRAVAPAQLADLEKTAINVGRLLSELQSAAAVFAEGAEFARAETAARRRLAELQSRKLSRRAAMETLREVAKKAGVELQSSTGSLQLSVEELLKVLSDRAVATNARVLARFNAKEIIARAEREKAARDKTDHTIKRDRDALAKVQNALGRAAEVRAAAQKIRATVERVRSAIIRREFNDHLNRLWRDLFVRLAPNEPFVPAFQIPEDSTNRLQPKLITKHRYGGAGGNPGAMLSAGNLNTAALTLFLALHLTMTPSLPWVLLDDPVQSMDDLHVAHFAALLRTLAKEQGRQVIIAVHDRQLFEYLRLELSPAFPADSLQTLELIRNRDSNTQCVGTTYEFKEETAIRAA